MDENYYTPWRVDQSVRRWPEIADCDGMKVDLDDDVEVLKRIAACVNACEGLSNEMLINNPVFEMLKAGYSAHSQTIIEKTTQDGVAYRMKLERDELLAQLKNVMSWIDNWPPNFAYAPNWPADRDAARAAIAKAEGCSHD